MIYLSRVLYINNVIILSIIFHWLGTCLATACQPACKERIHAMVHDRRERKTNVASTRKTMHYYRHLS